MTPLPLAPEDCPRFQTCNAVICPVDPQWPWAAHLKGERVCFYLLASAKVGAAERFADDPVYHACKASLEAVAAKHPLVRRAVEVASESGFRGGHLIGVGPPKRGAGIGVGP